MIELHTKKKFDKSKGRAITIISLIRINNRTVAKYNPAEGKTDLTSLKSHIGEKVYLYVNGGKSYSHKAKIDKIEPTVQNGIAGDELFLGPADLLYDTARAAVMQKALEDAELAQISGGVSDVEDVSGGSHCNESNE